ncbi:MAG: PRC-barrel domain-containing protein [Erythrobacter sp.]|jgi:hypothetical protein|nr:PRC-barrel domain-containing protein [Erythrobacter sp.]
MNNYPDQRAQKNRFEDQSDRGRGRGLDRRRDNDRYGSSSRDRLRSSNDRHGSSRNGIGSSRDDFRGRRKESGSLIASDRVEGTPVYDRSGDRLGTIENFMVGKRSGRVEYAVLSFGGFLGIGERHYPLPWDELSYDEDEEGYVVDITEEDLERAPSHRAGENMDYERGYGSDVRYYYGGY